MDIGRKKYNCKYPDCSNSYYVQIVGKHINKRFHRFPKNKHYHQLWKKVCKVGVLENASNYVVCEEHFAPKDFVNEQRIRLNFNAVPLPVDGESLPETVVPDAVREPVVLEIGREIVVPGAVDYIQCTCSDKPGTSTSVCIYCNEEINLVHSDSSNANISNNTSSFLMWDHDYCRNDPPDHSYCISSNRKFEFLQAESCELLTIGLSKKNLTPQTVLMYKAHSSITAKLTKLRKILHTERQHVTVLQKLYRAGKFKSIEGSLNLLTEDFINSQLKNVRKNHMPSWTKQEKVLALFVYKRNPRLYRYLRAFFHLPSIRLLKLKRSLPKITFEMGANATILEELKHQAENMKFADRFCTLVFNEISLSQGFGFELHKEIMRGFQDLTSLSNNAKAVNHALVFMVRGIRKQWKQIIAFYLMADHVRIHNLMSLIQEIVRKLQQLDLYVIGTVCNQTATNQAALSKLCSKPHPEQSAYYFFVNGQPIATIFDAPHLLKSTRNALLACKIQFEPQKFAQFKYILFTFKLDQKKTFKSLPKLKKEHFNFSDPNMKMQVEVAAAQLSSSVASAIETYSMFTDYLPPESIFTAEFVQKVDDLFDSLSGSHVEPPDGKPYRCALSKNSPHLEFWPNVLTELDQWKLIDLKTEADVTNRYSFIRGWQTTIRSLIFLWQSLQSLEGFDFLNLHVFNQDIIEKLLSNHVHTISWD